MMALRNNMKLFLMKSRRQLRNLLAAKKVRSHDDIHNVNVHLSSSYQINVFRSKVKFNEHSILSISINAISQYAHIPRLH